MNRRALQFTTLLVIIAFAVVAKLPHASATQAQKIPAALSDREFWELTEMVSETNGQFQSDNFLSNERGYQIIIPELLRTAKSGGAYLGVGPEQNYPYIMALNPSIAIIFDIRRGNLHEHLLYKSLFEMSKDRAEFLSRLFSRPRPAGLDTLSSVTSLMVAYAGVAPNDSMYTANLKAVSDWLTQKHGFALHPEDIPGIDYVFGTAFYSWGPALSYSMAGRGARGGGGGGGRGGNNSTYADIQALDDGTGLNRGFLGTEANWRKMKDFHTRNLLVPVVGDFGGQKAIRAVGKYLKDHGAVVSAFYLSNVEQYLNQNGVEQIFLCNVATLPLDSASTFIFTGAGRYGNTGGRGGGGGGLNTTFLRKILPDTQGC